MRIRTITTVLLAMLVSVFTAGAASAQDANYPPSPGGTEGTFVVSCEKSQVSGGDTQRCTATGANAGEQLDGAASGSTAFGVGVTAAIQAQGATFYSETKTADANGAATWAFTIPSDIDGATVTFTVTREDGTTTAADAFVVDNSLPVTGGQFTVGMALAAAVLLLGAALVLVSRRKTREFEVMAG
jgi:LPXTG-motif cell wall-anchored protein